MRFLACLLAALALVMSATVQGQRQDPRFPVDGTIVNPSPAFWLRGAGRTQIVLLPAGTKVRVIGREGLWYRIIFPSALGDQLGEISPSAVRIDVDSAAPSGSDLAQGVSSRGFVEARGFGFPQETPADATRILGDALVREELFLKPSRWMQLAIGADLRASSHDQVEGEWRVDLDDRRVLRPRIALRRLSLGFTTSRISLDLGKQLIRWGRADILSPVDRFAPRDYLNVIDNEFVPVLGARASILAGAETFEIVWLPQMTPSRLPLLGQRWTVMPPEASGFTIEDNGSVFPERSQQGIRWSHAGRFELGLSFFNGVNHLPDIDVAVDPDLGVVTLTRLYPELRTYGGEASVPTRLFTLKGEAAYFTSPSSTSEEYVLYVIEAERQVGEWLLDAGYAGEVVVTPREGRPSFAAERGMANSIIGRASYTVDPRRSMAVEGAARRNGRGFYIKGEFSQALGQHWRVTLAGVGIGGKDDDFLGQYRRNSHASATLRLSF